MAEHLCAECRRPFVKKTLNHKYCSLRCRDAAQLRRRPKWLPADITLPVGHYVYAWYKDGAQFPFYVGKGVRGRAWAPHTTGKRNKLAACERVRYTAKDFQVKIIREALTGAEAALVEDVLIAFLVTAGVVLENTSPKKRQTQPTAEPACGDSIAIIQDTFTGWTPLNKLA